MYRFRYKASAIINQNNKVSCQATMLILKYIL